MKILNILKNIIRNLFRALRWIWTLISYIPTFFIRTLTLLIIFLIIFNYFSKFTSNIKDGTALLIQMDGILVEQAKSKSSLDLFIKSSDPKEIEINKIAKAINLAEEDKNIESIVIDLSNFIGGYPGDIIYISETLLKFKKNTNKSIIAIADYYSQPSYILASTADEIIAHKNGGVSLYGWSSKRVFVKNLLDKLDIEVIQFSKGEYKSATEIFTEESMSDESKEANLQLQSSIWEFTSNLIEENRNLETGKINFYIENTDILAKDNNFDFASLALNYGLVDSLKTRSETEQYLSEKFPHPKEDWRYINFDEYLKPETTNSENIIGVISVAGAIMDGNQPRGIAGGDNISLLIKNARKEKNLKALILRVNTPGGSAFASELIREELMEVKNLEIPIIVSMGGVAASGGYWIAAETDFIFAHETTVTGSIGVAAILFNAQETAAKIGLNEDGIEKTPFSNGLNNGVFLKTPSDRLVNLIQGSVDRLYDNFTGIVSRGRNLSIDQVNEIARGRVWSGSDALDKGLIDAIGSFEDAVNKAKNLANIKNYKIKRFDQKKNDYTFLKNFFGLMDIQKRDNYNKNLFYNLKNDFLKTMKWHENLNDPDNLYFLCDECIVKY
ncbi:MAG: signal peptide peptidase SppA [Rhodobiaceae bacterium]|nr:signal peptide peptidase SppA [Rhodobiaceae bacterium]